MSEAPAPAAAATAQAAEPEHGATRRTYTMSPNAPFLKKLNAIKTPEEKLALVQQLRHQLEQAEKERGSFGEHLRQMHAKDAALAAKNLQQTIAAATNGDLNAAALAVKMSSIKPEDQQLALKHLDNMDASKLTTHKLMTLSMIEQNTHKLILNQLALHMESLTAAVQVLALQQKAYFSVLNIAVGEEEEATKITPGKEQEASKATDTENKVEQRDSAPPQPAP